MPGEHLRLALPTNGSGGWARFRETIHGAAFAADHEMLGHGF
jgi:hypothetical protein